ncbi:MAG TPA: ABC transporter ATP-binding protein [Acidimicrobiales bacterium]|jgi:oligopeptide transport system ATP-binding protein
MEPLLIVEDLRTGFNTDGGYVKAVDGISYEIYPGETFAIVGESGSGKSVSALTIMGLINIPPGEVSASRVVWKGRDLLTLPVDERRAIRGKEIAMIFQDPMTSLNPVHTIGRQIGEMSRTHEGASKKQARQKAIELLDLVGIPQADVRVDNYPHEFSGGMRQRAMIAMAIACKPALLIADEPTTALDVTVQAQVLEVIHDIRDEIDSAVMLITHDLGVVAGMADRVMVMYAGRQAELGTADEVFYEPRHPYTLGLLASLPRVDEAGVERLVPIIGHPPSLINKPPGCVFHPRCPFAQDMCRSEVPELRVVEGDAHMSACHYAETLRDVSRTDLAASVEELEELA